MLDIRFVRENPEAVKENIRKKFQDSKLPLVDEVIALDAENRAAMKEADDLIDESCTIVTEAPEEALRREYMEETGIAVKAGKLIGIRFSKKDWYAVFVAEYVEGEARSDGDENSEVIWMDPDEALKDDSVPGLTKEMIRKALAGEGFVLTPYDTDKVENHLYV